LAQQLLTIPVKTTNDKISKSIMFKRALYSLFLLSIYLSGIILGGVYTPRAMSFAKQFDHYEKVNQQNTRHKIQDKTKQNQSRTSLA